MRTRGRASLLSRRQFLKSIAAAATAAQNTSPLHASIARSLLTNSDASGVVRQQDDDWDYYEGPLARPWEVWQGRIADWETVSLQHCFDYYDGCDPDKLYCRRHGWYPKQVRVSNPLKDGRTLLHFEASGQTSHVYVGNAPAGTHIGGYDEYAFDITDVLAVPDPYGRNADVALAVLCDNSEDLASPPSDLSDYSLYGGLYRHAHLVNVPAVSIECVHIAPEFTPGSSAVVKVRTRIPIERGTGPAKVGIISEGIVPAFVTITT